jgi:hypothetical protein
MRTSVVVLALLVCASGAMPSSARAEKRKKKPDVAMLDASGCPRFSQRPEGRGVVFTLKNSCDKPIRCEIRWETRCDKAEPQGHEDGAALNSLGDASFQADSGCTSEQAWSVSAAHYSCHATSTENTAER